MNIDFSKYMLNFVGRQIKGNYTVFDHIAIYDKEIIRIREYNGNI